MLLLLVLSGFLGCSRALPDLKIFTLTPLFSRGFLFGRAIKKAILLPDCKPRKICFLMPLGFYLPFFLSSFPSMSPLARFSFRSGGAKASAGDTALAFSMLFFPRLLGCLDVLHSIELSSLMILHLLFGVCFLKPVIDFSLAIGTFLQRKPQGLHPPEIFLTVFFKVTIPHYSDIPMLFSVRLLPRLRRSSFPLPPFPCQFLGIPGVFGVPPYRWRL